MNNNIKILFYLCLCFNFGIFITFFRLLPFTLGSDKFDIILFLFVEFISIILS